MSSNIYTPNLSNFAPCNYPYFTVIFLNAAAIELS